MRASSAYHPHTYTHTHTTHTRDTCPPPPHTHTHVHTHPHTYTPTQSWGLSRVRALKDPLKPVLLKACKFIQRKEVVEALVYFGMMEEGEGVPVGGGAEAACLPSAGGVSVCCTVFMMCVCGSCLSCHTTTTHLFTTCNEWFPVLCALFVPPPPPPPPPTPPFPRSQSFYPSSSYCLQYWRCRRPENETSDSPAMKPGCAN